MPTAHELKITGNTLEMFLDYDPETGLFTRKVTTGPHGVIGEVAGGINDEGYVIIFLRRIKLRAHRLGWAWMTGEWPVNDIDHINGDRADNRFKNLREATRSQNLQNAGLRSSNKTGYKGVHFCNERQKYVAQIKINKWPKVLGRFQTLEEAVSARLAAEKMIYGEFAGPSSRQCFKKGLKDVE
jgi:hypothetical protein